MTIGKITAVFVSLSCLCVGCTMVDNGGAKKPATSGLISTPVSYYSTAKAKYLAAKYKDNLGRIIEQIVRNPKTAQLQFANNISSVGGIGFFTHSATKSPDERYLEVVLATPETFETKSDYSEKVQRLFSLYGFDLLRILNGDGELYQDGELSGYGLNLAWRNVVGGPAGNRVVLARAIIYLPKEKARSYLRSEIKQNELLADAVIFGEDEDRPLMLVSYRPQDTRPDVRPAIREDNLTATAGSKPSQAESSATSKVLPGAENQQVETGKAEGPVFIEPVRTGDGSVELAKQEPENSLVLEPLKTDERPSSELPSVVGGKDKSSISTTPVLTSPRQRSKPSDPAKEVKTEAKVSTPSTADKKFEAKQPTPSSRAKGPEKAAEKQVAVKSSVLPEAATDAPIEELQKKPPENVDSPAITLPTKLSSLEKAATPVAEVPTSQMKAQVETPKIVSELKEKPAESISVLPEKNTSVPLKHESETTSITRATVKNELPQETSAREAKSVPKLATPVVSTNKGEAVRPESMVSKAEPKPAAEKIANVAQTGKAQIEVPEPKPVPTLSPATPPITKNLGGRGGEGTNDMPVTPSSEKDSDHVVAVQTSTPRAPTAKAAVQMPPILEKTPSVPTIRPELKESDSKSQPVQETIARSSAPVPAQKATPEPTLRDQKQVERAAEPGTAANASGVSQSPQGKPTPPVVAAVEIPRDRPTPEQLALLKKPADMIETKPVTRPVTPLEGFVIQIAFNDKEKAQHWAESMERRGYAVSVTETGTQGALRVRLGNFAVRDEAERQLRSFRQEGMNGIIINLPQAFQPARSTVP